mmetsp:Transcript_8883/g.23198  ORF Transcript_8883/g.23198 Transcript_8883/m.23198 type:complete len:204 (+) Transcript_8883:76-687(+)
MTLSGRSARTDRRALNDLRFESEFEAKVETMDMTTTVQSIQFQGFRRYALGCRTKPSATILRSISTRKMRVKTMSRMAKLETMSAIPQQGGIISRLVLSQGSKTLPQSSSVALRGHSERVNCPGSRPLQSSRMGGLGHADALMVQSGCSMASVMEVRMMPIRMALSKNGCCVTAAMATRTLLSLGRKKKALWSGILMCLPNGS